MKNVELKNKRHQAFADEYLANGMNATQAYLSVYKSVKKIGTAEVNGSKLLRNAKVAAYIKEQQAKSAKKLEITRDEILADLKQIKDECKAKGEYPPHALKAIDLLNKMLGYYEPTRIEHSGDIGLNIPGITNGDQSTEEEYDESEED